MTDRYDETMELYERLSPEQKAKFKEELGLTDEQITGSMYHIQKKFLEYRDKPEDKERLKVLIGDMIREQSGQLEAKSTQQEMGSEEVKLEQDD